MITPQDRYDFTSGACSVLAEVLWRETGWPVYSVVTEFGTAVHLVVQGPDGDYLDVEGWKTAEDMLARWEPAVRFWREEYPLGIHQRWVMKRRFNLRGGYAYLFGRAAEIAAELLKGGDEDGSQDQGG